ncbi:2,3-bisphosphoglycerate-independent phosphoglycerate mutase [Psychromonas sp. MB-3u-54]|uniref:2,3-bisphosphoglycerate-independent phosphoglycerate mutase n=1 Tax=Psychromonas sp. MB-3u-54 TaxID=2058319 RepID=UPI000C33A7BD|nr:2,3-bisphosphoglycerate-independent phosphoglycerate mutase [Psychromonas sp. MB-3u-54]PKH03939.1 2,3-bisphosphoglycerate-independent phosphoglycerate mutase [Psychromonas sp. MB-3u-54]
MTIAKKPLVLLIMDGWGYRPDMPDNAVANAKTPVLDNLCKDYANDLLSASGMDVGLPDGQMGNSEVGHTNIGAGRTVYQNLTKVTKSIADGDFFDNKNFVDAVDKAVAAGKAVHIMGLASPGGVHSHDQHIVAAVELAAKRGAKNILVHAFLDGRDTPPRSAAGTLALYEEKYAQLGVGRTATLVGRYFAMDRDNRWDRVEQAYNLLTQAKAEYTAESALAGLENAYARDENDEFVKATVIGEPAAIEDGDAVLFMNFRADRARELTYTFTDSNFSGFERAIVPHIHFVTLTEFAADITAPAAFSSERLTNTLGEWLADHGKTQLRISETEKYAHVTFFFNGGVESEFKGEDRTLIKSPAVATYDMQPEMSSAELTEKLVGAIKSTKYDVIICNYPNGDMVGHTGVYDAAVKACEAVDSCVGKVVDALKEVGGECLITADHGNAEQMIDPVTGGIHTAHTNLPVPFIYVGRNAKMASGGRLCDIAPTMLNLIDMEIPAEMTGTPLITLK